VRDEKTHTYGDGNRMGVNDREQNRKDDKRRAQEATRKRRQRAGSAGGGADWSGVDGSLLAKATAAVSRNGGAIRYGYSRDGGAYAIGFYGDGDPFTEYVPPSDDIDEYLKGVIDDYTA